MSDADGDSVLAGGRDVTSAMLGRIIWQLVDGPPNTVPASAIVARSAVIAAAADANPRAPVINRDVGALMQARIIWQLRE